MAGRSHDYPLHLVELLDGGDPGSALKNLAAQLIRRYRLDSFAPAGLLPPSVGRPNGFERLLGAAADKAAQAGPPLVLVVDGLDGAPCRAGEMPLGLPARLPAGAYLVVSRRRGGQLLPADAPRRNYTLQARAAPGAPSVPNQQDVIAYLKRVACEPPLAGLLSGAGLSGDAFTEQLADKCAGIWIYLRYVLDEMQAARRPVADLASLPNDVWQYYARAFARDRVEDPSRLRRC